MPNPSKLSLFLASAFILCGLIAEVALWKMVSEVNEWVGEANRFSRWFRTNRKYLRLWREHKRLHPESQLRLYWGLFSPLALFLMFVTMFSFYRDSRTRMAQVIDGYKTAECIPVSANRKVGGPHTREWETPVTLSDGSKVIVVGVQMPGGRIIARYVTTGHQSEAAYAGDYVYPSDVRFNAQKNLLFVKTSGLAGGIAHKTWLFEYDLLGKRLIERQSVADSALPSECPESP